MTTVYYQQNSLPTAEWLLMQYAAGALPPYESMLVAAYLALNHKAQHRFAAFEAEGGRMIEEEEPVAVTTACLDSILAVIEPVARGAKAHPAAPRADGCTLPAIMHRLLAAHCPQQKRQWRQSSPGIAYIDIQLCHTEPRRRRLALMRVDAKHAQPAYVRQGLEITLVLEGSYNTGDQQYRTGDLVILDARTPASSPYAGDEGCVCMVLTEATARAENPLLQFFRSIWPR